MKIAVGLGASLGDRLATLRLTLRRLATVDTVLLRASRAYRTPPLAGGSALGWFVNGVALFETTASPEAFLDRCRALEAQAGRRRARTWGDRPLDLDLLVADAIVCTTPTLTLPHPAIARRPFVLQPLVEAWPTAQDPITGARYADLPPAPGPRPVAIGLLAPPRASMYGSGPSDPRDRHEALRRHC